MMQSHAFPEFPEFHQLLQHKEFLKIALGLLRCRNISLSCVNQLQGRQQALFEAIIVASNDIEHRQGRDLVAGAVSPGNALHYVFTVFNNPFYIQTFRARNELLSSRQQDFEESKTLVKFPNAPLRFQRNDDLEANKAFIGKLATYAPLLSQYMKGNDPEGYIKHIQSFFKSEEAFMPELVSAYMGNQEFLNALFQKLKDRKTVRSGKDYFDKYINPNSHFVTDWIFTFGGMGYYMGEKSVDRLIGLAWDFKHIGITVDDVYEYDAYRYDSDKYGRYYYVTHWAIFCRQGVFFKDTKLRQEAQKQMMSSRCYRGTWSDLYRNYFHIAIRLNYPEFTDILFSAAREDGLNETQLSELLSHALDFSIIYRRLDIFMHLIREQRDFNSANYEWLLFRILCLKVGHVEFMDLLIKRVFKNDLSSVKNSGNFSLVEFACEEGQSALTILHLLELGAKLRVPDARKDANSYKNILSLSSNKATTSLLKPQVAVVECIHKLHSFLNNPTVSYIVFTQKVELTPLESAAKDSLAQKIPDWAIWSKTPFYDKRKIVVALIAEIDSTVSALKGKESIFAGQLLRYSDELQRIVRQMPESRETALKLLLGEVHAQDTSVVAKATVAFDHNLQQGSIWGFFSGIMDRVDGITTSPPVTNASLITTSAPVMLFPPKPVVSPAVSETQQQAVQQRIPAEILIRRAPEVPKEPEVGSSCSEERSKNGKLSQLTA